MDPSKQILCRCWRSIILVRYNVLFLISWLRAAGPLHGLQHQHQQQEVMLGGIRFFLSFSINTCDKLPNMRVEASVGGGCVDVPETQGRGAKRRRGGGGGPRHPGRAAWPEGFRLVFLTLPLYYPEIRMELRGKTVNECAEHRILTQMWTTRVKRSERRNI